MSFIIGAQKSGTTYLFDELVSRHPMIKSQTPTGSRRLRVNSAKEPHFFHTMPLKDFGKYMKAFSSTRRNTSRHSSNMTFIDGTPDYIHIPSAACRIAATFPSAKLIVILRDPVMRALSHWNMVRIMRGKDAILDFDKEVRQELRYMRSRACSYESKDMLSNASTESIKDAASRSENAEAEQAGFASSTNVRVRTARMKRLKSREAEEAISTSSALWKKDQSLPSWNQCYKCEFMFCGTYSGPVDASAGGKAREYCSHEYPEYGLVRRGLYAYQLEWWLKLFPAEQLLVINHQQLNDEPEAVLEKVITFLDQDVALIKPTLATTSSNKINVTTLGDEDVVHKAFRKMNASGWSLPLSDRDAKEKYAETLSELYSYYAEPNADLYRLLEGFGPTSGWTGMFPAKSDNE